MDKQKKLVPITIRMPEEIHAWLQSESEEQRRSLNAEIVLALEKFYKCRQPEPTHRPERVP